MKKDRHDSLLRRGECLLQQWGVAADAAAEEHAAWIGRDPAGDLAIAHRLGLLANHESGVLLRKLESESTDKNVLKEARRSLYRLERRGVDLPPRPAEPVATVTTGPAPEGLISPIDGRGDQLVWLIKPHVGGVGCLFALINDPEGLRDISLAVVTRKYLRRLRERLREKNDLLLVEADWWYCDFLIYRAFRWARERRAQINGDYVSERARLLKGPPPDDTPALVFSRLDAEEVRQDDTLVPRSQELLEEKEFYSWLPVEEVERLYGRELENIEQSPLVLSRTQVKDRVEEQVRRAAVELFSGARGESYARRLQEMAYFFFASARPQQARVALAVALALADGSQGGKGIPFLEMIVRRAFAICLSSARQEEWEKRRDSLVITPAEFVAQQLGRHR